MSVNNNKYFNIKIRNDFIYILSAILMEVKSLEMMILLIITYIFDIINILKILIILIR